MRLIDADKLERQIVGYGSGRQEWVIKADKVDNAPTVEAIPIEWLKENLIGSEFLFGKGVDNTLVGETVWEMIVERWREDNGDEWWREEQGNETYRCRQD